MENSVVKTFARNLELAENLFSDPIESNKIETGSLVFRFERQTLIEQLISKRNRFLFEFGKRLQTFQYQRIANFLQHPQIRKLKQFLRAKLNPVIQGEIYSPKEGDVSLGSLEVSGWTTAKTGEITKIEAFIGKTKIGDVSYGTHLADTQNTKPSPNKSDCSFSAKLTFNPDTFKTGINFLKFKITDNWGNTKEFSRKIILGKDNAPELIKKYGKEIKPFPNGEITFADHQKNYLKQIVQTEPNSVELANQRQISANWKYRPLISIIIAIQPNEISKFAKTIHSIISQSYENWEICIVAEKSQQDELKTILGENAKQDSRITVVFLHDASEISKYFNEALKNVGGEFITILENSDEIAPNALFESVSLLQTNVQADLIYTDEDLINSKGFRCEPHFKPDWSPELFYSMKYLGNLAIYRQSLVKEIGGFREEFKETQSFDLVLRMVEKTDKIFHIPKVLYHRRKVEPNNLTLQRKALTEHFQRMKIEAVVCEGLTENLLRVKRKLLFQPKVSIIIPTCDKVDFLKNCINSIRAKTVYQNYEIIVVDNNSSENETFDYFAQISQEKNTKVIRYPKPFNFSAINNFAVNYAQGELLLFLNNDTEVISNEWLEAMVEQAIRPEVGAVGGRLLYFNQTVQHAGIITGISKIAGHSHKHYSSNHQGYFDRSKAIQNISAVTGACLMVKTELFKSLGGFDEQNLPIAFNDIDFCLRLRQRNLQVIYTPFAELYHFESASRGSDQTSENSARFRREMDYMLDNWGKILESDPYYNPNLTLEREDFSMANFRRN